MQKLSAIRLGTALGAAGAIFYLACIILLAVAPSDSVVWVFNAFMHGADVTEILRPSVPLTQSIVGVLLTFVGGYVFGYIAASVYNLGIKAKSKDA